MNNEPMLRMVITIHQSGQLTIEGIPPNKVMAYGTLEVAKESVSEYFSKMEKNLVQPANVIPRAQ